MQKKSIETILYSTIGVVVMLGIIVAFNFLAGAARLRKDMTQEKAYTLPRPACSRSGSSRAYPASSKSRVFPAKAYKLFPVSCPCEAGLPRPKS
jgi:hypothetical protein